MIERVCNVVPGHTNVGFGSWCARCASAESRDVHGHAIFQGLNSAYFICLGVVARDVDVNLNIVFGTDISSLLVHFVFGHQFRKESNKPLERSKFAVSHSPVKIEIFRIKIALPLVQ